MYHAHRHLAALRSPLLRPLDSINKKCSVNSEFHGECDLCNKNSSKRPKTDKEEDAVRLRVRWTLHYLLSGKAILQVTLDCLPEALLV